MLGIVASRPQVEGAETVAVGNHARLCGDDYVGVCFPVAQRSKTCFAAARMWHPEAIRALLYHYGETGVRIRATQEANITFLAGCCFAQSAKMIVKFICCPTVVNERDVMQAILFCDTGTRPQLS